MLPVDPSSEPGPAGVDGRVQAIVWTATGYVSGRALMRVEYLVDEGDPVEGLCTLAWAIVHEGVHVPDLLLRALHRQVDGLLGPWQSLPENLDAYALECLA